MSEKIMTLHPSPDKKGVNIDKRKYSMIKDAILSSIKRHNQIRFMPTLITSVKDILGDTFDGFNCCNILANRVVKCVT